MYVCSIICVQHLFGMHRHVSPCMHALCSIDRLATTNYFGLLLQLLQYICWTTCQIVTTHTCGGGGGDGSGVGGSSG